MVKESKSKYIFESKVQGTLAFRDFTIRDPRYFVILFEAKFHDFEEKIQKKIFFSEFFFFQNFFLDFLFFVFNSYL